MLLKEARQSVATLTTLREEDAELKSSLEADLVRLEKEHQQKRKVMRAGAGAKARAKEWEKQRER